MWHSREVCVTSKIYLHKMAVYRDVIMILRSKKLLELNSVSRMKFTDYAMSARLEPLVFQHDPRPR